MAPILRRLAARVLLVDEQERILLLRSVGPRAGTVFWFTPGGGIDPGEDARSAAIREVWEETGLRDLALTAEIWHRRHTFTWGSQTYDQSERWFLARVANFEPVPQALTPLEQREIDGHRWWGLAEMDASSDSFAPAALAHLTRELLRHGPPAQPLDIDSRAGA